MESESHAHYIFSLFVVFFAAFLSQLSGLEPIIGAFLSGVALNRLIPHSSALMNRIEFIGNSLFIPFFLISVGMLVNVGVLLKGPGTLIIAGIISLIALFGKWLAAWFTQLLFKYSATQRQLIYGLSSSRAAATLAVVLVGFKANILDEQILNGAIILILISCIVASFETERAAKRLVIESENQEINPGSFMSFNYEHILVPIANVLNIHKLVEFALLIKDRKSANPVSLLSIVPNNDEAEININKSRNELQEFVKHAAATEVKVNIITTIDHNTAGGIARISKEIMADIVVLGWPAKSGFIEKLVGEKIESIIDQVEKNLFICCFREPLIIHRRILLMTPPLAEKEIGYELWVQKIARMSNEISVPVIHFGTAKTNQYIKTTFKKKNFPVSLSFTEFQDWDDFLILSAQINPDDIIILVSSRKGFISYSTALDHIPSKLEKYFDKNSKMIVFPKQYGRENLNEGYDDISSVALSKGIEVIDSMGKGIGKIFKKRKES
jgi:hypothetical protein